MRCVIFLSGTKVIEHLNSLRKCHPVSAKISVVLILIPLVAASHPLMYIDVHRVGKPPSDAAVAAIGNRGLRSPGALVQTLRLASIVQSMPSLASDNRMFPEQANRPEGVIQEEEPGRHPQCSEFGFGGRQVKTGQTPQSLASCLQELERITRGLAGRDRGRGSRQYAGRNSLSKAHRCRIFVQSRSGGAEQLARDTQAQGQLAQRCGAV